MTAPSPRSGANLRWLLLGVAVLILGGSGWFIWPAAHHESRQRQAAREALQPGNASASPAPAEALPGRDRARRTTPPEETRDQAAERRIGQWLEDDKVEPKEAARRIWQIAADPAYGPTIRANALANALNLTDDQQFQEEFLTDLGRKDAWAGDLGEALLDDLYNRSEPVKVAAVAALLPHAQGEFLENLREVLRFQLEAEDADDATLIRLAANRAGASPRSVEGGR